MTTESSKIDRWAPALVGILLGLVALVAASCERLRAAEAPAAALLESGDTVCVLVAQGDEAQREVCSTSVAIAKLLLELERQATAPAPSVSIAPEPLPQSSARAHGGAGGP